MKAELKHGQGRKPVGEKRSSPPRSRGRLWLLGGAGLVFLAALLFYLWMILFSDQAVVAVVNREPVALREFRREILLQRGEVIAYFRTKYGAEAGAGFWTRSYGGEVPAEVVKTKAFQEIVKIKIELLLAKQAGLIEDISYRSLLENMRKENQRRKEAIANHQVIYGLAEFSEQTYFDYLMSDLGAKLKSRLAEEWRITDDELRAYYETIKDVYYVEEKPAQGAAKNNGAGITGARVGKSYVPFEKAKQYLYSRYLDIKYNEYIDQLAQTAEVKIHQNVYQRIRTDR